ncbi:glycosyltransferase [Yersinia wautersii]|uniref:Uncharacterized protein conserved in bacteria n=1 Tax=Yersinia pseudotuberculosis TaxID=633 RepID=A0A380Q5U0_YERPU|nr:glycosyltransferase [Yersinia pseudotuberculosis]CNC69204.1 Uncharacterized protein conserved in bacteria [Yersinia pseudotuberculosis]SUP81175.1 Uncharacterized protein conserved in bacteria [Yersinia pseudotuberculosis]
MKKILFVTCRYPYPTTTGDALRANKQLNELKKNNIVDLFCLESPLTESKDLENDLNKVFINKLNKKNKVINVIKSFFLRPLQCAIYKDKRVMLKLESILLNNDYDMVYFQLVRLSDYVQLASKIKDTKRKKYKILLDFVDSLSLNMLNRSNSETFIKKLIFRRESKLLLREEKKLLDISDVNIIISRRDADSICKDRFYILPNGVDRIPEIKKNKKSPQCNLVFFGNMAYYPNVKAAVNLVSKIYSGLDKNNYRVHIIGANTASEVLALEKYDGVKVHGFVDDIYSLLNEMDISVFPIYDGSGMQNKVLESFMIKLPVITTSIVIDGFECENHCALIANSTTEFIFKINELNENKKLKNNIVNNAKKLADCKYNWQGINILISKL